MFLPIAVLAMTAIVGCATVAGSDLGVAEVLRLAEEERNPALEPDPLMHAELPGSARMGTAHVCHARPGLLDSMQARALGCLD